MTDLRAQTPSPDTAAAVRHIKQSFASPCLPAHLGKDLKAQVQSNNTSAISVIRACESTRTCHLLRGFFTHLTHSSASWLQEDFGSETKQNSDLYYVSTKARFSTFLFKC